VPSIGGWSDFFLERFIRDRIEDWLENLIGYDQLEADSVRAREIGKLPSARIYRSSNLVIPNATWTQVLWNATEHDTDTMTSVGYDRLVVKTRGLYRVELATSYDNAAGSRAQVIVKVPVAGGNGIAISYTDCIPGGVSAGGQMSGGIVSCEVGDFFLAGVYQGAGGPINLTGGGVATYGFGIGPANTTNYVSALQATYEGDF